LLSVADETTHCHGALGDGLTSAFCRFLGIARRCEFFEWHFFGHEAQFLAVVQSSGVRVLPEDWLALLLVLTHELVEALVATLKHHLELEFVPALVEDSLDVGFIHREVLVVEQGALLANKYAKSNVRMSAPVFLAINAERVELVLVDQFF
jgi:hypothetical protein